MDQPADLTARDVLASVGDVMLRWGFLESAMLKALGDAPASPAIAQRWQAAFPPDAGTAEALRRCTEVRHLLAHGLCAVKAQPKDGAVHVVCRALDGSLVTLTLGQLDDAAQELDRLRLAIWP